MGAPGCQFGDRAGARGNLGHDDDDHGGAHDVRRPDDDRQRDDIRFADHNRLAHHKRLPDHERRAHHKRGADDERGADHERLADDNDCASVIVRLRRVKLPPTIDHVVP